MPFNLKYYFPNVKRRSGAKAQRVIQRNMQRIRINRAYLARKTYVPQTMFQTAPGSLENIIDYRYTPRAIAKNKLIAAHRNRAWAGIKPAIRNMKPYLPKWKRTVLIHKAFKPI